MILENKKMINRLLILFIIVAIVITFKVANIEPFARKIEVEQLVINKDKDSDGVLDLQDIINGARAEVKNKTKYKSTYYAGGYPPQNEGVCTDVIWRALQNAGYNLKELVDKDIKENTKLYPRVLEFGGPDPNIDFRRVQNLHVYFNRFSKSLTTDIIRYDKENLSLWQGGDIVVFLGEINHIGIVSDKRRNDGVPLLLHNAYGHAREEEYLLKYSESIVGHYRFVKED